MFRDLLIRVDEVGSLCIDPIALDISSRGELKAPLTPFSKFQSPQSLSPIMSIVVVLCSHLMIINVIETQHMLHVILSTLKCRHIFSNAPLSANHSQLNSHYPVNIRLKCGWTLTI